MMTAEQQKCSLCRQPAPLREGHLLPKFAVTWLKRTSGTGKLRGGDDPKRRMQDANRLKLLCKNCENRFSAWENYFALRIFRPCWSGIVRQIDYDERLIRFLASLTWRQTQLHLVDSIWPEMIHKKAIVRAEKILRQYLLGSGNKLSIDHHLWKVPPVYNARPIIKRTILDVNWYIYRSCDGTIAQDKNSSFIFALIPGFIIAAPLTNRVLTGMTGTKIGNSGKLIFSAQYPDLELRQFILNRAHQTLSRLASLSSRQWELIDRDNEANDQNLLNNAPYYFFLEHASKEDTT